MANPGEREVLFEMFRIGAYVKVTAVDPVTRIEASIVGSRHVGVEELKRNAIRKLDYVIAKRTREERGPGRLA